MNSSGQWLMMILAVVAVYLIWIFLKPKKTERKRFSIRERRLKRQEEREDKEDN